MEKMTCEKAHEILTRHMSEQNQECRCHSCDKAEGFMEGFDSREAEIEELKNEIKELKNELEPYSEESYGV